MLCEKHKHALIEAAVTGGELAPRVRAHVEDCANCAAELRQQRSLVAAIDTNVSRQMNVPVPAAVLQRVEAHLAQQPQPKRTPRFAQLFAGALATLVVAATVLIMLPRRQPRIDEAKQVGPDSVKSQRVDDLRIAKAPPQPSTSGPVKIQAGAPGHTRSHIARVLDAQKRAEPELLMPDDERVALAQFIAASERRPELVAGLVRPLRRSPEEPVRSIEIPDMSTAGIVIEPIWEETRR